MKANTRFKDNSLIYFIMLPIFYILEIIPFPLTIILILLKLFDKITISWAWVFSPLWIPLLILLSIGSVISLFLLIYATIAIIKGK